MLKMTVWARTRLGLYIDLSCSVALQTSWLSVFLFVFFVVVLFLRANKHGGSMYLLIFNVALQCNSQIIHCSSCVHISWCQVPQLIYHLVNLPVHWSALKWWTHSVPTPSARSRHKCAEEVLVQWWTCGVARQHQTTDISIIMHTSGGEADKNTVIK